MIDKLKLFTKHLSQKLGLKDHHENIDGQIRKKAQGNTYLQSKILWNDVYGSLQTKLENSYRIIFMLSIVIVIAIIGFVIVSGETKIKPIPFVIHGNDIITLNNQDQSSFDSIKPKLSLMMIRNFIRHVRSVSTDSTVNDSNRIATLSFVTGAASQKIKSFYEKHNANQLAATVIKHVEITSILRASDHTLNVRWRENTRSARTGDLIKSEPYIAQITYQFETPSQNPIILQHNPLGFEITQLSWSQDVGA